MHFPTRLCWNVTELLSVIRLTTLGLYSRQMFIAHFSPVHRYLFTGEQFKTISVYCFIISLRKQYGRVLTGSPYLGVSSKIIVRMLVELSPSVLSCLDLHDLFQEHLHGPGSWQELSVSSHTDCLAILTREPLPSSKLIKCTVEKHVSQCLNFLACHPNAYNSS